MRAIVLARTPDVPVVRNTGRFADLPKGHPAEPFLLYAEQVGIIRADPSVSAGAGGASLVHPDDPVSRAGLIVLLARAYNLQPDDRQTFTDVDAKSWYGPYAHLAATYRLFLLRNPATLEPDRTVTMSEVTRALILVDTLRKQDDEPVRIEVTQAHPAAAPRLYTVQAVRRQNVALIDAPAQQPFVRRTPLSRPLSVEEKRTTILTLVNAIRQEHGLPLFAYSSQLQQSAQGYADRMAQEGFFSHTTPQGQTIQQRIDATGFTDKTFKQSCSCIPGYALAENLAKGQKTAEEAVHDWMQSPEHRAAILSPAYTHTGIGLNAGIWVEHFGGVVVPTP